MTPGRPYLLPLRGSIKTYAWGSRTFLAALGGRPAPTAEPEAELWIGAHRDGSAEVSWGGAWIPLREAIARDPIGFLGAAGVERFGAELAFLLKVLAVARPLSLQVHPDRAQALAGYERERAAGVARGEGSYRDPRPKPELIVALDPLWALHGLLEPDEIRRRFAHAGMPSLEAETERLVRRGEAGVRDFLATLLGLDGERRSRVLAEARAAVERARLEKRAEASSAPTPESAPLRSRPEKRAEASSAATPESAPLRSGSGVGEQLACSPSTPVEASTDPRDSWVFWLERLLDLHPDDPAVLAPLFMNLVRLDPGHGLFQAPGVLHCYLEGAGIELMASSDNVVRAGLTAKPIDVAELLRVADPRPAAPSAIEARRLAPGTTVYTAAAELELLRFEASPASAISFPGPDALLLAVCTRGLGRVEVPERSEGLALHAGAAFAVRPGAPTLRLAGDLSVYASITPRAPRVE